ncbi:MAG TPA: flagellar M-ring protein FliF [Firmicutes bacterium]|nr:flagellar M-ring protein FliF [Bacillota bacterium]
MEFLKSLYEQAKAFWKGLSPGRRVALPVVVAAALGLVTYAAVTLNQPKYAPLFTGLQPEDAGAITAKLKESGVPYRLAENGSAILVPQDRVYETRIDMASQGLPKGGVVGFELFNETKLGTTDFERRLKYNWALQGELTRTIREMTEVEDARVHIVLPERSLFVSEDRPPTASVLLKLRPGRRLTEGQIYGIANLIAGSVEGLKPENVTILDSSGNVLSDLLDTSSPVGGAAGRGILAQLQVKRETERELQRELQTMLEPLFGFGKVVARVNAELNFDYKEQNSENYTPVNADTGLGILRSRQTHDESYQGSGGPGGVPGVSSNVPGYQAYAGGGTSQYQKTEATENYEVNRVQEKLIVAPGQIKRLSVAVWVDGQLTQAQLASVRQAVASAVGFNQQRGDQLFIDSMKFGQQELGGPPAEAPARAGRFAWAWAVALLAAAAVGTVAFVVARRKRAAAQEAEQWKGRALDVLLAEKQPEAEPQETAALEVSSEEQERVNRERQLRKYADDKPEEFANLLKTWLTEDEG